MKSKVCIHCKELRPMSDFGRNKEFKDNTESRCVYCLRIKHLNYRRSLGGKLSSIYDQQVKSSKERRHPKPTYTKDELRNFGINSSEFNLLYNNWVESGFKILLTPTFDRSIDSEGYSFGNFNKWMTWEDNSNKAHRDMRNGILINGTKPQKPVIGIHKKTENKVEFCSVSQAGRKLDIEKSNIAKCCRGKLKSAGGYYWEFKLKL